jgi:uncharacterized integral membrane protein
VARSGSSRSIVWTRRLVPMVVGAGLLYLAWRLATANADAVKVDFLLGRIDLALWQALATSFLLGAIMVGFYALYQMARGGLVSRRYRKQLSNLETEVHQLRNLPLAHEEVSMPELAGVSVERGTLEREVHEPDFGERGDPVLGGTGRSGA